MTLAPRLTSRSRASTIRRMSYWNWSAWSIAPINRRSAACVTLSWPLSRCTCASYAAALAWYSRVRPGSASRAVRQSRSSSSLAGRVWISNTATSPESAGCPDSRGIRASTR
ncbi:MAG: hypothetical protein A3E31_08615 [Candidatus Rokubacteria bacterium RIFCSPHIGHO2_12_FULL_73_22]|nr:MAG: hypothetical protein A3E31_08615 [Candidatus Rokubacteria bacterium RIFCSPHIGHO2_12_FULL_73_22]